MVLCIAIFYWLCVSICLFLSLSLCLCFSRCLSVCVSLFLFLIPYNSPSQSLSYFLWLSFFLYTTKSFHTSCCLSQLSLSLTMFFFNSYKTLSLFYFSLSLSENISFTVPPRLHHSCSLSISLHRSASEIQQLEKSWILLLIHRTSDPIKKAAKKFQPCRCDRKFLNQRQKHFLRWR